MGPCRIVGRDGAVRNLAFRDLKGPEEALLLTRGREDHARRLAKLPGLQVVASGDDAPVAKVMSRPVVTAQGDDAVSVAWEVEPDHRRMGVGTAVARAVLTDLLSDEAGNALVLATVDAGADVALVHLASLGFEPMPEDGGPASFDRPDRLTLSVTPEGFAIAMRAAALAAPAPARDERCGLSGLPVREGDRVAVMLAMHPRRLEDGDHGWEAGGTEPEEASLGFLSRGGYDGRGWVSFDADCARTVDEAATAMRDAELPAWTHEGHDLTLAHLGACLRQAAASGPPVPFGAMLVREDVLAEVMPAVEAETAWDEARRFEGTLTLLGVPLAPTMRTGRPGVDASLVAALDRFVRDAEPDAPAPRP